MEKAIVDGKIISIHSPAKGETYPDLALDLDNLNFNPLTREG